MKENNNPVRQHLNPKAYLKHFADDGRTYALRKKRSKQKMSFNMAPGKPSIKNLCVKKNFYTLPTNGIIKDPFIVEKRLSRRENDYFQAIDFIVNEMPRFWNNPPGWMLFGYDVRKRLVEAMHLQMIRGRTVRKFVSERTKLIYDEQTNELVNMLSSLFGEPPDNVWRKLDEHKSVLIDNAIKAIVVTSPDSSSLLTMLMGWRCELIINDTDVPFVASDEPVIVADLALNEYGLFHVGLMRQDSCIVYPLSPELLVVLYPSRDLLSRYTGVFLGRKLSSFDKSGEIVNRLNFLQMLNCSECVVSGRKEVLEQLTAIWGSQNSRQKR